MPRPRLDRPIPRIVKIKGRRPFYIRWTDQATGTSKVVSTKTEIRFEAEQALADFEVSINAPPPDAIISDILDAYLADRNGVAMSLGRIRESIVPLKSHLGHLRVDQIADTTVRKYHARKRPDGNPVAAGTIRRELGTLTAALNLARRKGWIDILPSIALPPKSPPRDRFMTKAEAQKLIASATTLHLRIFILIGLGTGARKGSILDLTWDRVDMARGIIDFRNPERQITKKRRGICPIGKNLKAALADAQGFAQTNYVIEWNGKPCTNIKTSWNKAAARAGLKNVTPHVMKHSVISWLAEDGYTIDQISDMTDTDQDTIRRIYRKVNPDTLQPMADTLDKTFLVTLL